ncbi:MAG: MBG domain-containing protein, partial [Ferruginibacter sp.]
MGKKIGNLFFLILISVAANSQAPQQPTNLNPPNGTINYAGSTVSVTVTDPNGDPMTVKLYGRKKTCTSTAPNFTIIGLPDTQFYTEELPGTNSAGGGHNGIFKAQTQWIADHRLDSNIAFVTQLGDCVQNGDNPPGIDKQIEWKRADTAMKNIESPNVPLTDGIPYGICVGNHDQSVQGSPTSATTYYNQYFGAARFAGRGYYGGQYGANNDNHYELFSSGGIDFIHISIEYYPDASAASLVTLQPVLDWADALLKAYPTRKGILSSHNLLNTASNFQGPGQTIYDNLKDNPNLFLMLAGHVAGEGRRSDTYNGNTVWTIMADYQNGYTNGGNGYLRIMQFRPAENIITVRTYSPYSNTSFTGATSQFSIPLNSCPFTLIGTNTSVASGSPTTFTWSGLELSTDYEWYVSISDGVNITASSISGFTTWNGVASTTVATTTAATPASIVYGTSSVSFTTTLSPNPLGGTVQFYVDGTAVGSPVAVNTGSSTATFGTYNPSSLSAGSHIIRGDFSGFGTYAASTGTDGNLTVSPKPLTITGLTANNKTYNQTITATLSGTAALSGVLAADGSNVILGGTPTATFANSLAANGKPVTVTGYTISGSASGNYTLTQPSALIADITKLVLNYTGTKVYDGNATFNAVQITMTNIIAGDAVTLTGSATVTGSSAGAYNGNFATNGLISSNGNYASVGGTGLRNFTITAKPIAVTATVGQSKIYGAANPVYTYTFSPALIGSDAFTGALTRTAGENVGNYAISIGTLSAGSNYAITFVPTNFAINAKPITVTTTAGQSKIYGAANPVYTYSFSPALISPDAFTGALSRNLGESIGNYAITQGSLTLGSNYAITFVSNNFAITSKIVTASLTGTITKVYDGTTTATLVAGNYSLTGVSGADVVILNNPATGAYSTKNVGTNIAVTVTGLA